MTTNILRIKELDISLIQPNNNTFKDKSQGGFKIVIIGKPGTGKTTLITDLLYHKKHIYPTAVVVSGTEDSNGHYSKIFINIKPITGPIITLPIEVITASLNENTFICVKAIPKDIKIITIIP